MLVAVDLHKAFDSVSHEVVLETLQRHSQVTGSEILCVHSCTGGHSKSVRTMWAHFFSAAASVSLEVLFFARYCSISSWEKLSRVYATACTNDVMTWTKANDHSITDAAQQRLRQALDTFTNLLEQMGMEVSVAETHHLAVRGTQLNRAHTHFTIAGQAFFQSLDGWCCTSWACPFTKTVERKSG